MLKDVEKVGMAGNVVKVTEGFAKNFLIPQRLAKMVVKSELDFLDKVSKNKDVKKEVIASKIGMLAERIRTTHISVKKRAHDDGKLYGAVSAEEVVAALKAKDIIINKKQVEFAKTVKTLGEHVIFVKLNSRLRPELNLKVIEDKAFRKAA
jgi:large subunit ribosomal protein L9